MLYLNLLRDNVFKVPAEICMNFLLNLAGEEIDFKKTKMYSSAKRRMTERAKIGQALIYNFDFKKRDDKLRFEQVIPNTKNTYYYYR